MAAAYCFEGIPLRFLASLFDIQMRYLVYMHEISMIWIQTQYFLTKFLTFKTRDNSACVFRVSPLNMRA